MNSIIYEDEKRKEEEREICIEILQNARNELYLHMRFLHLALGKLKFAELEEIETIGTDGNEFYFQKDAIFEWYRRGRTEINRAYLHSVFHCLFGHLWKMQEDEELWDLACDIVIESVLDGLYLPSIHVKTSPIKQNVYGRLRKEMKVLSAEAVYYVLKKENFPPEIIARWKGEFTRDNHRFWERGKENPQREAPRQQEWEDIKDKMQTEIELFSKEASKEGETLLDQLKVEHQKKQNYREFLKKFSVLKEEIKVDLDSFDYIFYNYGMSVYGNMPLIEPLETKEEQKIEEFVIVIDTSMSCKEELVQKFLEETYSILSESERFFRKIHIHIIQCDEQVQEDRKITSFEELKTYMENLTIKGQGGTDFRPAFEYVNSLLYTGTFQKLRGLLYFTDGYGSFPVKMPPYETAFIFLAQDYRDIDVPPWAIKLILDSREWEELS